MCSKKITQIKPPNVKRKRVVGMLQSLVCLCFFLTMSSVFSFNCDHYYLTSLQNTFKDRMSSVNIDSKFIKDLLVKYIAGLNTDKLVFSEENEKQIEYWFSDIQFDDPKYNDLDTLLTNTCSIVVRIARSYPSCMIGAVDVIEKDLDKFNSIDDVYTYKIKEGLSDNTPEKEIFDNYGIRISTQDERLSEVLYDLKVWYATSHTLPAAKRKVLNYYNDRFIQGYESATTEWFIDDFLKALTTKVENEISSQLTDTVTTVNNIYKNTTVSNSRQKTFKDKVQTLRNFIIKRFPKLQR